ncbi:hypothetical protein NST30_06505 [Bacillus sp. FSL K6-3846]|uniref:hypothetical protein n=1 Tax=Bacillus TaxID=1386 RepID=UPI000779347F|nr:hypothetical protein [Bacillus licheniformis]OMI06384.1 hypothetical protein BVL54_21745 [Bacillus paralicheniformis]KYC74062.1 hypothetical protein B4092_1590 [Bacillus licheniformis]MCD2489180.1 hypothetical protein [Bacillus licheniformis]MDE1415351.1 hypothetical protein [Bacillus licheniformis]MEC0491472.1 hypothetical protein [Bacillus licheniformis]
MDTKKTKNEEVEGLTATRRPESLFYIQDLREHSKELFGVKPEVLDGALFGLGQKQVTKTEAKKRIREFLRREAN